MPFLQTIDPYCQPIGPLSATPNPYTIDPFTQPLAPQSAPPPPPPPPRRPPPGGGGGVRLQCPPGTYWDPVVGRCIPLPVLVPAPEAPEAPELLVFDDMKLDPNIARATAAAIGLTIEPPETYEIVAAQIGLEIDKDDD